MRSRGSGVECQVEMSAGLFWYLFNVCCKNDDGGCPSSLAPYIDVTAPWLANGPNMMTCAGMPIVNLWK